MFKVKLTTNKSMDQLFRAVEQNTDLASRKLMRRLYRQTTLRNQSIMGKVYSDTIVNNRPGLDIMKWDGKSDVVMIWWFHEAVTEWVLSQLRKLAPDWPWEKQQYPAQWAVDSANPPKYRESFELASYQRPIAGVTKADEVVEIFNVAIYARRLEPDWGNAMVKKGYHVKVPTGVMTTVAEAAKSRYRKAARVMFTFEDYKTSRYPVIKIRLPRSVLQALRR